LLDFSVVRPQLQRQPGHDCEAHGMKAVRHPSTPFSIAIILDVRRLSLFGMNTHPENLIERKMDEKTKAELERLFNQDRARAVVAQKTTDERAERESASVAKFSKICSAIIQPAMKEVGDLASSHGWKYDIQERSETAESSGKYSPARITMEFRRNDDKISRPYGSSTVPHFSVICDKREDSGSFHASTIGQGHGGTSASEGGAKLDAINSALVHSKMLNYLRRLLEDAKPISY
jgi:hypothetical protein